MADDYMRTRTVELMRLYPSMRLDAIVTLARSEENDRLHRQLDSNEPERPLIRLVGYDRGKVA